MTVFLVVIGGLQIFLLGSIAAACILLPRYLTRQIDTLKSEVAETARAFVESPDEQTPSPLAALVNQFAELLAARLWQQVETRIRGANGALTRDMNKAEAEAMQAQMSAQNPLMGVLYTFLPKKVRAMIGNPQFLAGMGSMMGGGKDNGNEGESVQGRLQNMT